MNTATRWLGRVLAGATTLVFAACGGGGSAGPATPESPLHLESAAAVTQSIGPAGGTVSTTAADGTIYTLTVPAKSLRSATSITLAPIASIADLPSGVSLAGGAHLGPEGQRFDAPVKLSIARVAPAATPPVPFTYDGELQQRRLYPAIVSGSTIEFEIVHFSGYAALVGQPDVVALLVPGYLPQPSAPGDQALQALVGAATGPLSGAARTQAMRSALQGWLDNVIKPAVVAAQAFTSVDVDPPFSDSSALAVWTRLRNEMQVFDVALKYSLLSGGDIDAIADDFRIAVRDAARHVIPLFNVACDTTTQPILFAIPDIFAWQELARYTGAEALDSTLSRASVLQALCVQVAYDPNGGVDFPTGIQPGQSGTLGVRAGYSVNGGPVRFDQAAFISTIGTNTTTDALLGGGEPVAAGATYQQQFLWQPAATEMRIDIDACVGDELLREICQQAFVVRGSSDEPFGCQEYKVQLGSQTATGRSTVRLESTGGSAIAFGSAGGVDSFAGVNGTARSIDFFKIDAHDIAAPFQAVVRYRAMLVDHNPDFPGKSVSITMAWPGGSQPYSELGTFDHDVPITLQHGDVVRLQGDASATSTEGVGASASYSIFLSDLPAGVRLIQANCP